MTVQMTAFVAFMVLTERRIQARRWDCLCCIQRAGPTTPQPSVTAATTRQQAWPTNDLASAPTVDVAMDLPVAGPQKSGGEAIEGESAVKRFFRLYYAPVLTRWWVKALVIAIFLGLGAASWYGVYQVEYGQPLSDLAPDGSYLADYDAVQQVSLALIYAMSASLLAPSHADAHNERPTPTPLPAALRSLRRPPTTSKSASLLVCTSSMALMCPSRCSSTRCCAHGIWRFRLTLSTLPQPPFWATGWSASLAGLMSRTRRW